MIVLVSRLNPINATGNEMVSERSILCDLVSHHGRFRKDIQERVCVYSTDSAATVMQAPRGSTAYVTEKCGWCGRLQTSCQLFGEVVFLKGLIKLALALRIAMILWAVRKRRVIFATFGK